MTLLTFTLAAFGLSLAAGLLGSLLGLGGGIVVVPALTLLLGIDIRYAIGASIVSVIATSSGAAASYVKEHMANLRVAMLLEVMTTAGAISGAYLTDSIPARGLYVIFGVVMAYTAFVMWRGKGAGGGADRPDKLADRLRLHGSYPDAAAGDGAGEGGEVHYRVRRTPLGLAVSYFAGLISGLLGIGGGAVKVPTMTIAMGLPIKAATATSNLMIGVTGAASAGIYFMRGDINPAVAAPVAVGVLLGATGGSRLLGKIKSKWINYAFVAVVVWISIQMLVKGVRYERGNDRVQIRSQHPAS